MSEISVRPATTPLPFSSRSPRFTLYLLYKEGSIISLRTASLEKHFIFVSICLDFESNGLIKNTSVLI